MDTISPKVAAKKHGPATSSEFQPPAEGKKLCGNCGKEFSSKQSLSRHKRNCGRSTLTPCEKCHKQFARIDSLKRHIISCERRRTKPSTCNICHKVFRNNWFLRRHLPCKGNVICPRCHRGFRKMERYQVHYQHCHVDGLRLKQESSIFEESCHGNEAIALNSSQNSPDALAVPADFDKKYENRLYLSEVNSGSLAKLESNINEGDRLADRTQFENHAEISDKTSDGSEEIKVYILDEDMMLANGARVSTCDSDSDEEGGDRRKEEAGKENGEDMTALIPRKSKQECEAELKNYQLANRLSATLRCVFEEEGVGDVSSQMKVMTLAMENLGFHLSYVNKKST